MDKLVLKYFTLIRTIIAVLIGIIISVFLIYLVSKDPGFSLKSFLLGPVLTRSRFSNLIESASPIIFCGLAIAVAFQARQFNVGAEGSLYLGAAVGTAVAVSTHLPIYLHVPLVLLTAAVAGGLWGAIPGVPEGQVEGERAGLQPDAELRGLLPGAVPDQLSLPRQGRRVPGLLPASPDGVAGAIHPGDPRALGNPPVAGLRGAGVRVPVPHKERVRGAHGRAQREVRPVRRHQRLQGHHPLPGHPGIHCGFRGNDRGHGDPSSFQLAALSRLWLGRGDGGHHRAQSSPSDHCRIAFPLLPSGGRAGAEPDERRARGDGVRDPVRHHPAHHGGGFPQPVAISDHRA